jgi:hypothetical protein
MTSAWRLLGLVAAVNMTLGVGTAAAQRVMVRHAPAGTPIEVVLNGDVVGTGTVPADGDVTIPFTLPEKDGKAELDAYIFVETCQKMRRVIIADQARAPAPAAEGCDRREISGLYWVRRVNTIVIDLAPANPTLLLVTGNYTPPRPLTPEEEAGEPTPHAPLPKGLVMYAGAGQFSLRDFVPFQCGNAPACSGDGAVFTYGFGATYWITRNFGIEGSYMNPSTIKVSGGDTFAFDTGLSADVWSVLGKAGVQAGAVRIYGQGGMNYHQATITTTESIDVATQKIEFKTRGWNWIYGGGAEVWIKKIAIYGEFDVAWIRGDDRAGGEAKLDDRARVFMAGIRVHVGG